MTDPQSGSLPDATRTAQQAAAEATYGVRKHTLMFKLGLLLFFLGVLGIAGATVLSIYAATKYAQAGTAAQDASRRAIVTAAGQYASPDGQFVLIVMHDATGGVRYSVNAGDTQQRLAHGVLADARANWFMHWDEESNLWVWNGTDDGVVHRLRTLYSFDALTDWQGEQLQNAMPDTVRQQLQSD